MKSLSRRFLISVGLMSLVVTVFGTVGAFVFFERELSSRQISHLTDYVRERSQNVDRQFTNLSALHQAAADENHQHRRVAVDLQHPRRVRRGDAIACPDATRGGGGRVDQRTDGEDREQEVQGQQDLEHSRSL